LVQENTCTMNLNFAGGRWGGWACNRNETAAIHRNGNCHWEEKILIP
jgi:hypothetical protein